MKKLFLLTFFSFLIPVKIRVTDDINFSKKCNFIKTEENLYKLESFGMDIPLKNNSTLELILGNGESESKTHKFIYLGIENSSIFMYLLSEMLEASKTDMKINIGIFGNLKPYEINKKD